MFGALKILQFVQHVDQTYVIEVDLSLFLGILHQSVSEHVVGLAELPIEEVLAHLL